MINYAPVIGDIVPAFTKNLIKIPYQNNPAVKAAGVNGFDIIVKDFLNSSEVATSYSSKDFTEDTIKIELEGDSSFTENQYYIFQIAYKGSNSYSSTAVGKCIQKPVAGVESLTLGQVNPNIIGYQGSYSCEDEPLYSYRFTLLDEYETVLQDSGEQTSVGDLSFTINQDLEVGGHYALKFWYKTVNEYEETITYAIVEGGAIPSSFTGGLALSADEENGAIIVSLTGKPVKGEFKLLRQEENKKSWDEIAEFSMCSNSDISKYNWSDKTIRHEVEYRYAVMQFSGLNYSEKIISDYASCDFEFAYLSDAKRQFKIAYNAKVSSFKDVLQESKIDTIGGRYPSFFRNGAVRYKEIPISGLISYRLDEKDTASQRQSTISETATNKKSDFRKEREYKLDLLAWLTNGEPKYFRSPQEGNYIVQLMNVSLSPEDKLQRMIHSFSATGYEVAEDNAENLRKFGIGKQEKIENGMFVEQVENIAQTKSDYYLGQCCDETMALVTFAQDFTWTGNMNGAPGVKIYCTGSEQYRPKKPCKWESFLFCIETGNIPDDSEFTVEFNFNKTIGYGGVYPCWGSNYYIYDIKEKTKETLVAGQGMKNGELAYGTLKLYPNSKKVYEIPYSSTFNSGGGDFSQEMFFLSLACMFRKGDSSSNAYIKIGEVWEHLSNGAYWYTKELPLEKKDYIIRTDKINKIENINDDISSATVVYNQYSPFYIRSGRDTFYNLSWTTLYPSTTNSIKARDEVNGEILQYYNVSGSFKTPVNKKYYGLLIPGDIKNQDQFSLVSRIYNTETDDFATTYLYSKIAIVSTNADGTITLSDDTYEVVKYYLLVCTGLADDNQITFTYPDKTTETISFINGQSRYFYNLDVGTTFEATNVSTTAYARVVLK